MSLIIIFLSVVGYFWIRHFRVTFREMRRAWKAHRANRAEEMRLKKIGRKAATFTPTVDERAPARRRGTPNAIAHAKSNDDAPRAPMPVVFGHAVDYKPFDTPTWLRRIDARAAVAQHVPSAVGVSSAKEPVAASVDEHGQGAAFEPVDSDEP